MDFLQSLLLPTACNSSLRSIPGISNPILVQPEYVDDPNAPFSSSHQAMTSDQRQKSNELLADRLSRYLSQIKDNAGNGLNPTIEQIGDAIVTAVIENAVDIVRQCSGPETVVDGPTVDETIDEDEGAVDATTSRMQCDTPGDMVESKADMPETRKRLRDVKVSQEMETVEQFESPVKRSKAELFVSSEMTVSLETEMRDREGHCATGADCCSPDSVSTELTVEATSQESSLVVQSLVEKHVDGEKDTAHHQAIGTEGGVSKQDANRNGITSPLTPSGAAWQWTVSDVGVWLLSIGMGKYQQMFNGMSVDVDPVVTCEVSCL